MAADPWADFTGTPTAPPAIQAAPASSPSVGQAAPPTAAAPGQPAADPWADFAGTPVANAQTPAPAAPPHVSGTLTNLAAGANDILASTAGLPVDLVTGGLNLASRGINAVAGTSLPQITDPVGGSASIRKAMGYIGADPDNVVSADGIERAARAVGQGAAAALIPAGAGALAVRTGLASVPAAEAAVSALGAPTAGNVALSSAASLGGQQAAEFVPEPWRPAANMLGSLGVGLGGAVAANKLNALSDYLAPLAVAPAKMNALSGLDGQPIIRDNGAPIAASPGQTQEAGRQLQGMLADPAAAREALAQGGAELVPGSKPTTFQVTQDPLLGQYERGMVRSGPEASAAATARDAAQNDARVAALRDVAPEGTPDAVVQQAKALDPAVPGAAKVAQARSDATAATNTLGGNLPPGSEGPIGATLRAPIAAANTAAKADEGALWQAVDPNGTLGVPMQAIRSKALDIVKGESPNAAPMDGAERQIFQTATTLPDTQSFRDLSALRSRITNTISAARTDPARAQEVRRLSMLLDGLHDVMNKQVGEGVATEAAAQAGVTNPNQDASALVAAWVRDWQSAKANAAITAQVDTGTVGRTGPSGQSGLSSTRGAASQAGRQLGDPPSNSGLQGPPALTPTWDEAAAARYAAARAATSDRKATFQNAPGVGTALRPGPTSGSFTTPDHAVPAAILTPGASGAARVQAYLTAGGSPDALNTAAAFQLRQMAMKDGVMDPAGLQRFQKAYGSALSAMPELQGKIGTVARAQEAVGAAEAQHAADVKAYQSSLLGKLTGGGDPTAIIGQALRNPTMGARDMRALAAATADNPDARAGLQRAVVDHILGSLKGDQLGVGSSEAQLHAAQFQKFIRQAGPALREVMTPQQVERMEAVAADLQRSNLSVSGTRVKGGSDTTQNMSDAIAGPGGRTILNSLVDEGKKAAMGGTAVMTGLGGGMYLGGPLGAAIGGVAGAAPMALRAVANARAAGMETVNDLVREAMMRPELAAVLLSRLTPKNQQHLGSLLAATLGRASLMPGGVPMQQPRHDDTPQRPRNALSGLGR